MRNCASVFRGKTEALLLLRGTTVYTHKQWRAEIPKDLQNRAKINPIVKTVKNF